MKRDIDAVAREYNIEKYGSLLQYKFNSIQEAKLKELELAGIPWNSSLVMSFKDKLMETSVATARGIYCSLIKHKVESYFADYYCELGCGYGYNLSYINRKTYGGEYSKNAVKLAGRLGQDVREFNFYDIESYDFIKENSVIFTAHAIEQIPDASPFLDGMSSQRDKINHVIHFEPTVLEDRNNPIRNKYAVLKDYNRNLYSLLKNRKDIEIIEFEQDVIGLNPLNPAHLIVWKFKSKDVHLKGGRVKPL